MHKLATLLGLIGAIFLAIPPLRQNISTWRYHRYFRMPWNSPDVERMDQAVKKRQIDNLIEWNMWDTLLNFLGATLLALAFLIEYLE